MKSSVSFQRFTKTEGFLHFIGEGLVSGPSENDAEGVYRTTTKQLKSSNQSAGLLQGRAVLEILFKMEFYGHLKKCLVQAFIRDNASFSVAHPLETDLVTYILNIFSGIRRPEFKDIIASKLGQSPLLKRMRVVRDFFALVNSL